MYQIPRNPSSFRLSVTDSGSWFRAVFPVVTVLVDCVDEEEFIEGFMFEISAAIDSALERSNPDNRTLARIRMIGAQWFFRTATDRCVCLRGMVNIVAGNVKVGRQSKEAS